jgi:IS5 family transposase
MTHFRKRFNAEIMAEINEILFLTAQEPGKKDDSDPPSDSGTGNRNCSVPDDDLPEPKGDLILDATCTPADIHYPIDITLLNDARGLLATVIDELHQPFVGESRKPRDYREQARKHFLSFTKTRRPSYKRFKATIRRQLGYVAMTSYSLKRCLITRIWNFSVVCFIRN